MTQHSAATVGRQEQERDLGKVADEQMPSVASVKRVVERLPLGDSARQILSRIMGEISVAAEAQNSFPSLGMLAVSGAMQNSSRTDTGCESSCL